MLLSFVLGFFPALLFAAFIYWLDRYEKEPLPLLGGVFLWGAVVAAAGAFALNTIFSLGIFSFTGSEAAAEVSTASISAPLVEESLKGLAVLLVFWLARKEFDSILDGIVYAGVTALGFAATENTFYIYQYGFSEGGWAGAVGLAFIRVVLVGWQHPFFTAFIGIGLAVARSTRRPALRISAPAVGWLAAVLAHSLHNILAGLGTGGGLLLGFLVDWAGWLAMFAFILLMLGRERAWLAHYLRDEVTLGIISAAQYRTACSAVQRTGAALQSIFTGGYRTTQRFYQLCAELAHKKRQIRALGDEGGNAALVEEYRRELAALSPQVPF